MAHHPRRVGRWMFVSLSAEGRIYWKIRRFAAHICQIQADMGHPRSTVADGIRSTSTKPRNYLEATATSSARMRVARLISRLRSGWSLVFLASPASAELAARVKRSASAGVSK